METLGSIVSNFVPNRFPGQNFGSIFQGAGLIANSIDYKNYNHLSLDKKSSVDSTYFEIGRRVHEHSKNAQLAFHESMASEKSGNIIPGF